MSELDYGSGWMESDGFRWGRARKEFISKPSTSKASKEQKRQRKARKIQRRLQNKRG